MAHQTFFSGPEHCTRPYLNSRLCSLHIQDISDCIHSTTPTPTSPKQHRNTTTKRHKLCDWDYLRLARVYICAPLTREQVFAVMRHFVLHLYNQTNNMSYLCAHDSACRWEQTRESSTRDVTYRCEYTTQTARRRRSGHCSKACAFVPYEQ